MERTTHLYVVLEGKALQGFLDLPQQSSRTSRPSPRHWRDGWAAAFHRPKMRTTDKCCCQEGEVLGTFSAEVQLDAVLQQLRAGRPRGWTDRWHRCDEPGQELRIIGLDLLTRLGGLVSMYRGQPSVRRFGSHSVVNKTEDPELQLTGHGYVRDCGVMIIWLQHHIPDTSVQLAGRTLLCSDRMIVSGKRRGSLCLRAWCNSGTITAKHGSPDLEYKSVRCRTFFLPRL